MFKRKALLGFLGAILGLLILFPVGAVYAETVNLDQPNMILDNFDTFDYRTPGSIDFFMAALDPYWIPPLEIAQGENEPYWWTITNNGWFQRAYNMECSPVFDIGYGLTVGGTECVSHEVEDGNGFMRLNVNPYFQLVPDEYHETALTEVNHGYSFGEDLRWSPEPGHPVTMIAKMRWSDAYNADGTGDFVGSSGIYLWNMPADYKTMTFHGAKAIGIDLVSDDTDVPYVVGLGVTVVDVAEPEPGGFPVYMPGDITKIPVTGVDIHEWLEFKMTWYEDTSGNQSVKFWINGTFVQEVFLDEPLPSLAIEAWNDNYVLYDIGGGAFVTSTGPYSVSQSYDVDFIKVFQN